MALFVICFSSFQLAPTRISNEGIKAHLWDAAWLALQLLWPGQVRGCIVLVIGVVWLGQQLFLVDMGNSCIMKCVKHMQRIFRSGCSV